MAPLRVFAALLRGLRRRGAGPRGDRPPRSPTGCAAVLAAAQPACLAPACPQDLLLLVPPAHAGEL